MCNSKIKIIITAVLFSFTLLPSISYSGSPESQAPKLVLPNQHRIEEVENRIEELRLIRAKLIVDFRNKWPTRPLNGTPEFILYITDQNNVNTTRQDILRQIQMLIQTRDHLIDTGVDELLVLQDKSEKPSGGVALEVEVNPPLVRVPELDLLDIFDGEDSTESSEGLGSASSPPFYEKPEKNERILQVPPVAPSVNEALSPEFDGRVPSSLPPSASGGSQIIQKLPRTKDGREQLKDDWRREWESHRRSQTLSQ